MLASSYSIILPGSLPSRGAWIEMITVGNADIGYIASLPSRGAWIEIRQIRRFAYYRQSLPSRGAWIEIAPSAYTYNHLACRSPRGERGLKWSQKLICSLPPACRSPRGERGLKFFRATDVRAQKSSLPSRGAWIEIEMVKGARLYFGGRSPRGERGLKSETTPAPWAGLDVAPLAGSVD